MVFTHELKISKISLIQNMHCNYVFRFLNGFWRFMNFAFYWANGQEYWIRKSEGTYILAPKISYPTLSIVVLK